MSGFGGGMRFGILRIQGYLAHEKTTSPRTFQQTYAYGPTAILGGGAFSYERVPLVPRVQERFGILRTWPM